MSDKRYRILIGKPGLDGHDRGAKVVARMLRDAGYEVIYTGLHQTPSMIVAAAIQEDVDAIGLSIMSGAHNHLVPTIIDKLREQEAGDIPIFVGGIIPDDDHQPLLDKGVAAIFTPGASMDEIVSIVKEHLG